MDQLQTTFCAPPTWLATMGFPTEPFCPTEVEELIDRGYGGYWGQHGGRGETDAITESRLAVYHAQKDQIEECQESLQKLEQITFYDVIETHLDPELLAELGISRFSETAVLAISSSPISPQQKTATFQNGDFRWDLQRMHEDPRKLPYVGQYSLSWCQEQGMPFTDYWLASDVYIEPAHIREARRQKLVAERAKQIRKDPLLVGHWAISSVSALFILARW